MNKRTIRVTGKGKLAVKPDVTRIVMTVEGTYKDYDKTLEKASKATENIKNLFCGLGFADDAVKTTSFNIDTEYENYLDEKTNQWKNKFKGYRFSLGLKAEFSVDNILLGKVLFAVSKCEERPEFRILYTVKDKEACKNELLAKAVEDSKAKAVVLAKAAEVKLGQIQAINYSWGEDDIISEPMRRSGDMLMCKSSRAEANAYDINIEVDDIEVTDTVTVIWEIG